MSSFQDFFVHNNPEAEAQRGPVQAALNYKTEREHTSNSLGFCLRVTVNEKLLNLKMPSSILSVLIINL